MLERLKFQARIQGAEIDDDAPKKEKEETVKDTMLFKAPGEYDDLSKKERKELTEKMKGFHKQNIKIG